MAFDYSEDRLAAALRMPRKRFATLRREKTAAGQWESRDGEVFYTRTGIEDMLIALGLARRTLAEGFVPTDVAVSDLLLEKTRVVASSAAGAPSEKNAAPVLSPSTPTLTPVTLRILSQYPNRSFWRAVDMESGKVVDLWEPKKPWLLRPRKLVQAEPVPGKTYLRLHKPQRPPA